jgi:HD-GYP domain-containing protein (c-di-GMP phosphodiesterase class II)
MVDDLALRTMGVVNPAGCISLKDYFNVQPVDTAILAVALGKKAGLSKAALTVLVLAALLKDIACIYAPSSAANENELRIKEGNFLKTREHPVMGYNLVKPTTVVSEAGAAAVLQHHEYWNGTGFPRGLKGPQISPLAQIVTLAYTFAFLLSVRPERKRFAPHEAIEYIMAYSGDLFNPDLVELFVREVPCYSSGLKVEMNNGNLGFVTDPNLGFVGRPKVRLCWDRHGEQLREPNDIDLADARHQQVLISQVLEYE